MTPTAAPGKHADSAPQRTRAYVGPCLVLVCLLHVIVGIVDAAPVLAEAASAGWVGAFSGERGLVMWFLMTGFIGAAAGLAITFLERSGKLPWTISISLLITGGLGVSMAPASGFLLVLGVAVFAIVRSWLLHGTSGSASRSPTTPPW